MNIQTFTLKIMAQLHYLIMKVKFYIGQKEMDGDIYIYMTLKEI